MRLFIAIHFDEETKKKILAVQGRLKDVGRGNFSRPENLHLTLSFLGEISPNRLEALRKAMDQTPLHSMELLFDKVGCFRREGGDIWWIGLAENKKLVGLQSTLSRNLIEQGFAVEHRRFSPHLTLARELRVQGTFDRTFLLGEPFRTKVDAMSLMCSQRINGKLTYTEQYTMTAKEQEEGTKP